MSGLVLKLAPRERVLINGAVIENGDRRGCVTIVTPSANVLRLRDAIHPEEAKTPVRRLCYAAQLILTGDAEPAEARQQLIPRIEELSHILVDSDSRRLLSQASDALLSEQFYQCLKALRALIPREDRLLSTKA
ncbi:flagellar biosynthesis repressor FlbT [Tropicibacter naphthalenivorans]|uniref:Flagellar biosynthesis repressor FlbT n=1 Tax=Tropicibacter naphthalenivorans TaxID=441103 RepID=A0A0P1GG39_9RHOB|nr:flagellar biosynthesis repressor FlbT [Tropicibacter naphthalenivorans]CUH80795.1 flagellar biosynthesis repressor FlbT [Tropicibacter naphthalenivorans]SMC90260.1 flagellar protein FlbT [Tropicibacter naphthalenivorans]